MPSSPRKTGHEGRRDLLRFLSFLIVFVVAIILLRSGTTGIEWEPGALRSWFERSGNLTPLLFFLLFPVLVNLMVPFTLLSIVAGMLFGLKTALILVLPATILSHAFGYAISAWFLRDTVRNMLDRMNLLRFLKQFEQMSAWRLSFAIRFTPLSLGSQNYLLGLARISFLPYLIGSLAGTLPWMVAFILVGASADLTFGLPFLAAIVAWGVLVLVASRWWRRQGTIPDKQAP